MRLTLLATLQPVVRYNLANMARQTEALQAWTEAIVYQHSKMNTNQANIVRMLSRISLRTLILKPLPPRLQLLGGNTALLKGALLL